jgi:hypothetical protein
MNFAIASAYAHGTSALRTHLINMTPMQLEMTWPTFDRLRALWAGKVGNLSIPRSCHVPVLFIDSTGKLCVQEYTTVLSQPIGGMHTVGEPQLAVRIPDCHHTVIC